MQRLCRMILTNINSLGLAIYYKKKDTLLGAKLLLEGATQESWPPDFSQWWENNHASINHQVSFFSERGIRFTHLGATDYPPGLAANLDSPPLWLTYEGDPKWDREKQLAVVGSRKISALTKSWIQEELFSFLQKVSVCVLSGGARGVDQAAHFCAMRAHRPTYVILPSGLMEVYPKELYEWKQEILQRGGCFLSEYWPDVKIQKHFFIQRNRLLAAMADAVLVVQGEKRSGTMLTAQWAIDLGRDIGVVPGHPMDSSFSGNLGLIRSGVTPIVDQIDLFCMMSAKGKTN